MNLRVILVLHGLKIKKVSNIKKKFKTQYLKILD